MALASRGDRPFAGESGEAREPSTLFWDYLFSRLARAWPSWASASRSGRCSPAGSDLRGERKKQRTSSSCSSSSRCSSASHSACDAYATSRGRQDAAGRSSRTAPRDGRARRTRAAESHERSIRLAGDPASSAPPARRRRVLHGPPPLPAAYAGRLRRTTELVDELAALLDDTLDDLRAEPDPRRAVIAAYARMERALAAYGLPRRAVRGAARVPRPHRRRRSHERLPSARRLVFELTHLFERAKFSPHAIDAEMKDDAIATLATLRDELRPAEAA